ncbi:hypothetical protein TNCV_615911 [Trichonephila clavipes]|nr:hypothetical protein TNCV_615911 [Trichonephila clavipes]
MHWTSTANPSFTTYCIQGSNRNTEMCGGSILLEPHGSSVDQSGEQAECRVLLDDPLECPAHTLTRKRSCAARVRVTCGFTLLHEWLLWVLKIPSLEKRRLICEQHGCFKKGIYGRFVAASTTVERPDEVQSHILLVTGRTGSEMDVGQSIIENPPNATV